MKYKQMKYEQMKYERDKKENMGNIILIGMPGSGKSTVGVVLAKVMGYRFLDSDLLIQEEEGKILSELIEEYGDARFIQIENDVNKNIHVDRTVIATGGSAVYGTEAMEHFKKIGTVVYLEVPQEEIILRVGDLRQRGVVSNGKKSMEEIYQDRIALYEKYADVKIDASELTIKDAVAKILGCKAIQNRL